MWIFLNCCLEWFPKIFEYLQSAGGDEKVFVWTAVAEKGALPNVIIIIVITFITVIITAIILTIIITIIINNAIYIIIIDKDGDCGKNQVA